MADNPQGQNQNQGGAQKPSLSWQAPAGGSVQKPAPAPAPKQPNTPNQPKSSSAASNTGTYVVIFIVGLIIGMLLGWAIAGARGTSTTATSTATGASSTTIDTSGALMNTSSAPGITLDSAQPAGLSVEISNIEVSKPTWVVVYDDNNGAPGRALGATLFLPASMNGETSGTIDLLRPTISGTTYLVGENTDNGDMTFSPSSDTAVAGSDGKAQYTQLKAQ